MRKLLRRLGITIGVLTIGLFLFHLIEDWRGLRAWNDYQHEQEAKGVVFSTAHFAPPPVQDSENFAAVPLVADAVAGKSWKGWPLSDGGLREILSSRERTGDFWYARRADLPAIQKAWGVEDLEVALKPYAAVLDTLGVASKRPKSRLLIDYSDLSSAPPLLGFRTVVRVLRLRSLVYLKEGKTDLAFEDVMTGLRVTQHFRSEPHLVSQLLRNANMASMLQPIWEGMQDHQWSDHQLKQLQMILADIGILESWRNSCSNEHGFAAWSVRNIQRQRFGAWVNDQFDFPWNGGRLGNLLQSLIFPKGWAYRNYIVSDRSVMVGAINPIDASHHRVYPDILKQGVDSARRMKHTPYNFLGFGTILSLNQFTPRAARTQVGVDEASIACALERHRLAKGRYPKNLEELSTTFLPVVPMDPLSGDRYHYRVNADGTALIYSVGWDQIDDGGRPIQESGDQEGFFTRSGDWVWTLSKPGGSLR